MKDKKLIQLFSKLYLTKQLTEFKNYLIYASSSKLARLLFVYLYNRRKNLDDHALTPTRIFKHVYPSGTKFNQLKLDRLAMLLSKIMDDFLVFNELKSDRYQYFMCLSKAYSKHQLDQLHLKVSERLKKLIPDEEAAQYLAQAMLSHHLYYDIKANLNKEKKSQKDLDDSNDNLDAAYAILKLKVFCEKLVREAIFGEDLPDDFEASYTRYLYYLDALPCKDILIIRLLRRSATFLYQPDFKQYEALKTSFVENVHLLVSEKKFLLLCLVNGLTFIKYPNGRLPEYFKLYKLALKLNLFIENGRMSSSYFNNIIHVAFQLEEYDWAEDFITQYFPYLRLENQPDKKENIKRLYSCYILFGKKEYQKVLDILKDIHYEDFTYGLRRHILELKCLYELGKHDNFDEIDAYSSTFTKYLWRKKKHGYISAKYHSRYSDFIDILKTIAEFPYNKETKDDLRNQLSSSCYIVERIWLEVKIEEL